MYHHTISRLRGPVTRNRAWWKVAPEPLDADAPRLNACSASEIRTDLVSRVRREIAEGRYDTPQKWNAALDRLLDRLERA